VIVKEVKRHTVVCDQCRRRKQRCEGGSPCSSCQHNRLHCNYTPTTKKRGRKKLVVGSLDLAKSANTPTSAMLWENVCPPPASQT
jgi:Fungal Zn(2)-Cys(6) binuclear cluster domain